jgi:hypothetical protein
VIEEDYPAPFKKWHEETSSIITQLRTQGFAQMMASVGGGAKEL